jgi:hypothetical protein
MVACTYLWLGATVYGAIVIMPKPGTPIPFPQTQVRKQNFRWDKN